MPEPEPPRAEPDERVRDLMEGFGVTREQAERMAADERGEPPVSCLVVIGSDGKPQPRRRCPSCGKHAGVPILWGLPDLNRITEERRDVWIGGCLVTDDDAAFHCTACRHEWGRVRPEA